MNRNALVALLRLRGLAVDDARRVLADRLSAESVAEAQERLAETAIAEETVRATSLDFDDGAVEAFGLWLKRARVGLRDARAVRLEAAALATQARAILAVARGACETVETMLTHYLDEERLAGDRRSQSEADEAALAAFCRGR